jgi:hypothetical protein
VPASASATGAAGSIAYDDATKFFYIATAENSWRRAALSKWPLVSLDYLLVGGGGGGGAARGGGGGAGGVLSSSRSVEVEAAISVNVGSGGAGTVFSPSSPATNGSNSSLILPSETIVALGGGFGANGLLGLFTGTGMAGGSGGSGGGGSGYPPVGAGGSGTVGQGFAGGAGKGDGEPYNGGSGGGAGGAGSTGRDGAVGISDAFLVAASAGASVGGTPYVGGGGGAGVYQTNGGTGGSGGGGTGGGTGVAGTAGAANTGGGGGGGGNGADGGSGGSGLVILRVADTFTGTTTGSPTVYVTGGYRYYKFTQNGTITLEVAPMSAPTSLTATGGNAQVSLAWTAPDYNGGSEITDYSVQFSTNSGSTWSTVSRTASTTASQVVSSLTNGTAYVFRVAGINANGTGTYTAASSSVTPSASVTSSVQGSYNLRVNPNEWEETSNFFVGKFGDGYLGNHVWRATWNPAAKPSSIISATLVFNTGSGTSGSFNMSVRGANLDNAPANSDGASLGGANQTSASASVATPSSTATALSINVTSIVSQIVGRAGWTPGNAIKIFLLGDNASNGSLWFPSSATSQMQGTLTIVWSA